MMGKYKIYHGPGRSKVTSSDKPGVVSWKCRACGKVSYHSRKDAKTFARTNFQDRRMRYYQCRLDDPGSAWHITSYGTTKTTAYREFQERDSA
jgi:ribosomal protein L37E